VHLYRLEKHPDRRGSFFEVFRKEWLPDTFNDNVQVNCSSSTPGVLRGLHYHKRQWDFWVPVSGKMTAGLADLRKESATYGKSLTIDLDGEEPAGLLIPPFVAHGYAAKTDLILIYAVNTYFDNTDEYGIAWNDPVLSIDWGITAPLISERDSGNEPFGWDQS